jgi:hypothetical protein
LSGHIFQPSIPESTLNTNPFETEEFTYELGADCLIENYIATAKAWGKTQKESWICCEDWKNYIYWHNPSIPEPERVAGVEGSAEVAFDVVDTTIIKSLHPSWNCGGSFFRSLSSTPDIDGILGPDQDSMVFAFNMKIDTVAAKTGVTLYNYDDVTIPTTQTFTPSESVIIVHPDTAEFDCSDLEPYSLEFDTSKIYAKSCPTNNIDDCPYDFIKQCTPKLLIMQTSYSVAAHISDIYAQPISDDFRLS